MAFLHRDLEIDLTRWLLRITKLAGALRTSLGRRALRFGVAASEEHRRVVQALAPLDLVLDVGANRGQFTLLCKTVTPTAVIEAWEPLDDPSSRFAALLGDDPSITLHRCALGEASAAQLIMYQTRADDSSSLLLPLDPTRPLDVLREVGVEVRRLDDYDFSRHAGGRILLKLDVQGYEDRVLSGAERTLELVTHVLVELTFGQYYSGQASATGVLRRLMGSGFDLVGVHNVGTFVGGHQADFLLARLSPT